MKGYLLATLAFVLLLAFTTVSGLFLFWGNDSMWTALYFFGVPLAGSLYVARRLK